MSQLSLDKFGENLPVSGIVAFSQVAIGLGAGLLVADNIRSDARRSAGVALITVGAAALIPVVWGIASKISSRPESSRAMRKKLEGIRGAYDTDIEQ
ncbi:MAG: hypothetical protein CAK90_00845 [Spartobacteria bacterium AMD-G4]|jgi:hypothetical protein|nr:MAG: hypothetical protein CAK90_00845 [Spartobacteria bacterium AMD-G4]